MFLSKGKIKNSAIVCGFKEIILFFSSHIIPRLTSAKCWSIFDVFDFFFLVLCQSFKFQTQHHNTLFSFLKCLFLYLIYFVFLLLSVSLNNSIPHVIFIIKNKEKKKIVI